MAAQQKHTPVPFAFEGKEVRALAGDDGEPWFVASDVAKVLGYSRPNDAVRAHCKAASSTTVNHRGAPGSTNVSIIPERDVYRLIMRSKLPAAERFEEWVVGEVLPTIRRTGSYANPAQIDMKAVGGMMKGVVTKALHDAVESYLPQIVDARLAADPRIAVRYAVSAKEVLNEQKVPSRGRRGLVRRVSNRLLEFSATQGYRVHYCARTGTRLFEREAATAWLDHEGRQIIRSHMDAVNGQARLRLVDPDQRTDRPET